MSAPQAGEDILQELRITMARVEVKLDHAIGQGSDHETRLRLVEQVMNAPLRVYAVPLAGLGAVLSGAAAAIALVIR